MAKAFTYKWALSNQEYGQNYLNNQALRNSFTVCALKICFPNYKIFANMFILLSVGPVTADQAMIQQYWVPLM